MPDTAEQIVKAILLDLTDRRGLRHEWESIDEDIQDEIKNTWINIVKRELNDAASRIVEKGEGE